MYLGYVTIYVENVVATVAFYEKAFKLKCRFVNESNVYAEMDTGKTALAFVDESIVNIPTIANRLSEQASGVGIGLVVDDVESHYRHAISHGAVALVEPNQRPWGQTVAYVKDNNGFIVEICGPVGH